jgi:hypothetical protein
MFECKQKAIYDVGFIDPYIINERMLQHHPRDVENDLFRFFSRQSLKREILFPYNFNECFYHVHIFFFAYSMLSVIDELCMRVYSFHWVLLKIQFDTSSVQILNSLDKPDVLFSDMKAMLHK